MSKQRIKANVLRRFGRRCFYCWSDLTQESATLDHYVPRSQERGVPYNLRPACLKCNRAKGDLTAAEFRKHICLLFLRVAINVVRGRSLW